MPGQQPSESEARAKGERHGVIKAVLWNCEGMGAFNLLEAPEEEDIIVLVETWATQPFSVRGYYAAHSLAVRADGPGRPSGGVSILYKPTLGKVKVLMAEDDTVCISSSRLNVMGAYARPQGLE